MRRQAAGGVIEPARWPLLLARIAWPAQDLESLRESALDQPHVKLVSARTAPAAPEQFVTVSAPVSVDVIDSQVRRGLAAGASIAVAVEDRCPQLLVGTLPARLAARLVA